MSNKKVRDPVTKGRARVPVIMQMEALECGAASLAMVMAYYGKWIPLEQVRLDCGVSRDGSNAKNMLVAARSYGFEAQGFRCETEALREGVPFPCIIHWNFNHFVVLNGFRGKYAWINDPARGEVKVPIEDFDQAFTGICLQITPGENFEPSGKKKSTLAFARSRLKGAGAAVAFVLLSTVIGYLFGIINPVFSRFFMDRLLTGENRELLYPFLVLMIVMGAAQVIVSWIQAVYSLKINGKMAIVGSSEFMWKVLRMPMEFFSQRLAGDILQRQGTNASIAATLVNTLTPLLLNTIMMVFYLVVMLRNSVLLTVVGLVTIVLNLVVSRLISAKRVNITRVQMRDSGKLAAATVSGIQMVETIKASGAETGRHPLGALRDRGRAGADPGRDARHAGQIHARQHHALPGLSVFLHVSGDDDHFRRTESAGDAHRDGARGRRHAVPDGSELQRRASVGGCGLFQALRRH